MGRKCRLGHRAMSEGWCHDTDYFLGPEFILGINARADESITIRLGNA